jgi:hypothetical protein
MFRPQTLAIFRLYNENLSITFNVSLYKLNFTPFFVSGSHADATNSLDMKRPSKKERNPGTNFGTRVQCTLYCIIRIINLMPDYITLKPPKLYALLVS